MKIYLAGGFKSNWQERVISSLRKHNLIFYNPRTKEAVNKLPYQQYSTWDAHFIKNSNLVLAYAERTNPSLIGLSVEMGYAKGLGKTVVLVLEPNVHHSDESLCILKHFADITFFNLEDAIKFITLFDEPI